MQYISAGTQQFTRATTPPAPYIRKSFELDFKPEKAVIRITTNGFYRLYINGKEITKCPLAPYISNSDHLCYYDEYEIAELLNEGKNAIGFLLGNGHANPFWHALGLQNSYTVGTPVKGAVELTATDGGKTFSLESDASFKTHPSPVIDLYRYGVRYDARQEVDGWNLPDFDDSNWENVCEVESPAGKLIRCEADPIILREERKPIRIELQNDFYYMHTSHVAHASPIFESYVESGYLYDFGINTAGLVRLKIRGERGQVITMRFGEKLYQGRFNINSVYSPLRKDLREYIRYLHTDVYTLKGGEEEIFVPFFTYHGFRYVLVEGLKPEQATEELLTYLVMNSDVPHRADFKCSDETFNTLYRMGINSDLSNFWYFPTDCPHREKSGWTNDMSMSMEQFLLNLDCAQSLGVWLDGYLADQREDGTLSAIIPTVGEFARGYNGVLSDSNLVNIPYYCYKFDGRVDIAQKAADAIRKYMQYSMSARDERGLVANSLGDWAQPGKALTMDSDVALIDSALLIDMCRKCQVLFHLLGDEAWVAVCDKFAQELRTAIRAHLVEFERMGTVDGAQTSQALALAMGIFDESEHCAAYRELIARIAQKRDHVYCGMAGLRYIFHVLCENGDADLAYTMISRPDAPSYGNMIVRGATALCECLEDNLFNLSENHHFFGDILNLFISDYAGLHVNPNMRDCCEVLIKPCFASVLDWAEASYTTPCGKVTTGWRKTDTGYEVSVFVPEGVTGNICLKEQLCVLPAGPSKWHINF